VGLRAIKEAGRMTRLAKWAIGIGVLGFISVLLPVAWKLDAAVHDKRESPEKSWAEIGRNLVGRTPRQAAEGPKVEQVAYDSFGPWEFKPNMAKTKVPGLNLGYSFTLKQAIWVNMGAAGGYEFHFQVGGFLFDGEYNSPGHSGQYGIRVTAPIDPAVNMVTFWYDTPTDPADVYWVEIPCSLLYGGDTATRLTASSVPIGEKGATHAKENRIAEEWFVPSGTVVTATIGGSSFTETSTSDVVAALGIGIAGSTIDSRDWVQGDNGMNPGVKYVMSIEDIACGSVTIDTSSFTARTWGSGGASAGKLWVEGFGGDSIGFWASEAFAQPPFTYDVYTGGAILAPYSYDFNGLSFLWMDNTPVDDSLQVYVTGLRQIIGGTVYELPWHGTIAELRALGRYVQQHGCYYWDTQIPDCQAEVAVYLDMDSAETLGIEIRGPQPEYKSEAAGWSGGTVWTEGYVSPVDGPYSKWQRYNGSWAYTNGSFYIYKMAADSDTWGIGPGPPTQPYYIAEDGGPSNIYAVNLAFYKDSLLGTEDTEDEDDITTVGQRYFSGLFGYGMGPVVSASSEEAISVNSDCAEPSFKHDATVVLDTWPLDATARNQPPHFTDVVSLTADVSLNIYGDAHTHEDWVVTNGSAVDVDGNFTIYAGGGSLTLTLKCNYRDRQSKVGGVGQIAVPEAYLWRKHDAKLGQGIPPETAEAVWDWRGFYLSHCLRCPSVPMDVTYTIKYYMDLLGIGDNHITDSTRQTEYTYDAGSLYTLTRTIPVSYKFPDDYPTVASRGMSPIIFDLYDEGNAGQPVAMAYSIAISGLAAGNYQIDAPSLCPDAGDRQEVSITDPFYREAPEASGFAWKCDESWGYQQGKVSAHINGFCRMVMFTPDNAKGCLVERCCDTLNVSIGKTGQDFTSNYSLGGWPMDAASERFEWTHNQGAEDAHMVDEDDVRLAVLGMYDIAPIMHTEHNGNGPITPSVAKRVGKITCVRGLPYTFYGTKYVGGRGHGMALTNAAYDGTGEPFPRKRAGTTGKLYRRHLDAEPDDSYDLVRDGFNVGEHGHWASNAQPILDTNAARSLWEYFIRQRGEFASIGRYATREYAIRQVVIVAEGKEIYVVEHSPSQFFVIEHNDGIKLIYTSGGSQWYADAKVLVPYDLPKQLVLEDATDGSPGGYATRSGRLYVYHVYQNNLHQMYSDNYGVTFSQDTAMISGENISKCVEAEIDGRQYCFALDDDGTFWCYTSSTHFTDSAWHQNTNKFSIAPDMDETANPGWAFSHGKLYAYCMGTDDTRQCFVSVDFGKTWDDVS